MDLLQAYKNILISLGMKVEETGLVSLRVGDSWTPATVNGKRLVLPTHAVLANPDWESTIGFHPLSEKIIRGESTVLKALRVYVNVRLTYVITALLEDLMRLAVDTDRHAALKPAQLKALRGAPEANANTLTRLIKVLERVNPTSDNRIINIYQKRGGELGSKKYSRVAIVSFPITSQMYLEGEPFAFKELFGVSGLSALDSRSIVGLLEYIVPEFAVDDIYSSGSRDIDAPYFHSLMLSYIKIAEQLNRTTTLMAPFLNEPEDLLIDLSWTDMLDDLSVYRGCIPSLEGNEGELSEDTTTVKRANANVMSGSANARVTTGSIHGGSERVPYVAPAAVAATRNTEVVADTKPSAVASDAAPSGERLSSWANTRNRIHGNNPPIITARNAPPPGYIQIGTDQQGHPVYGPPPAAPVHRQLPQPQITTIQDHYGNLIDGVMDAQGFFTPLQAPQPQYPQANQQYQNQPPLYGHQRQTDGYGRPYPQTQQPRLSGRQMANAQRPGINTSY